MTTNDGRQLTTINPTTSDDDDIDDDDREDDADDPRAMRVDPRDRRARREPLGSELRLRGRRQQEGRPDAPDEFATARRREKRDRGDVAQPVVGLGPGLVCTEDLQSPVAPVAR